MTATIAQMLNEARRVHEAHLAAADISARLVVMLEDQLAARDEKRAIGVKAAARLVGVHPRTIVRKARAGELPHARVGDRWQFDPAVVIETFRTG